MAAELCAAWRVVKPSMLKRTTTVSTFYPPGEKRKLKLRQRLRIFTDDRRVEGTSIIIVLIYFLLILLNIVVPEVMFSANDSRVTVEWRHFIIVWQRAFWVIDLVLLLFFLIESVVRVYAWGMIYLCDVINIIDFMIIFGSFVMLWIILPYTMAGGEESSLGTVLTLLRIFRVFRIVRLIVILMKIKKSRETAQLMRQKAKFKRLGSPVERVIDILAGLKRKAESTVERDHVNFMIEAIVSGDLYTVHMGLNDGRSPSADSSMDHFLRDGGARETRGSAKKGGNIKARAVKKRNSLRLSASEQLKQHVVDLDGIKGSEGGAHEPGDVLRSLQSRLARELIWVDSMLQSEPVLAVLSNLDAWDFNIFELDRASGHHPIVMIVLAYVIRLDLDLQLPIDVNNLVRFALALEAGYKHVPFHNMVHAADVVHGTAYFMMQDAVYKSLTALDLYCMILGAAMHDFEHPGVNNNFMVASRHEVAILYNDSSVLENFHLSSSFKLMRDEKVNPFAGFSPEQYRDARSTMVLAILGTDMKFHFDHLVKFKTRVSAGAFEEPDRKDVQMLLAFCLHAADVSNPAKHWELSSEWSCRVMEEFFQQGEQEAKLGLLVSPFMDRAKTDIGKCQAGFISILIKPFFEEWCSFLGAECKVIASNVDENVKMWAEKGEAALGGRAEKIHSRLPWGEPPSTVSQSPVETCGED